MTGVIKTGRIHVSCRLRTVFQDTGRPCMWSAKLPCRLDLCGLAPGRLRHTGAPSIPLHRTAPLEPDGGLWPSGVCKRLLSGRQEGWGHLDPAQLDFRILETIRKGEQNQRSIPVGSARQSFSERLSRCRGSLSGPFLFNGNALALKLPAFRRFLLLGS